MVASRKSSPRLAGLSRSLDIYFRDTARMARMTALYAGMVRPGDLVFDIGAHVGDRVAAFRNLGCRVVAVEPQPHVFRLLRLLYARDPQVALVRAAVSDSAGRLTLRINSANPTVSTASPGFIAAAEAGAEGWHGQRWDEAAEVEAITLDALIARYGLPAFVKIDVEGLEDRVLAGVSVAVPALSFEFTTLQRDVALRALERLRGLGAYRYNAALGESHSLVFGAPQTADDLAGWLTALPAAANSGDVYALATS